MSSAPDPRAKDLFADDQKSMINQGKKINKGLLDWKESFGSKVFLNSFYVVDTNKFNLLNDL